MKFKEYNDVPLVAQEIYERLQSLSVEDRDKVLDILFTKETSGNRIYAIKAVRAMTCWGLKESKDFVDRFSNWTMTREESERWCELGVKLYKKDVAVSRGDLVTVDGQEARVVRVEYSDAFVEFINADIPSKWVELHTIKPKAPGVFSSLLSNE